ncbi:hypothetical protein C8R43DRAFT_557069 [Mycena crocata]|nr:hypothetical protein C8R43DRAFT_557069 [Mycena crocata]
MDLVQFSLDATAAGGRIRAMDRALIADIAAQIIGLQRTISALRIEQDLAQKRLDSYIYPVLTLPNEITSEIFVHFLPIYPLYAPLKGPLSPTLLTHICRQWRDIAHATPALWRATSLSPRNDEQDNNILQPWIARSRHLPLSIHINGYYETLSCMKTLALHRARWEYLQSTWMAYDVLPFLRDPMPRLRHLDVLFTEEFSNPIPLGDAPLLRSVGIYTHPDNVILPWRQLTSLSLHSVVPGKCTAILQQTALLVDCKVSFSLDEDDLAQQPDINLPCLKSLILLEDNQLLTPYIYSLIVPALSTLQIPETDLGPDPIGGLRSFLSKSGCKLRELHIAGERLVTGAAYGKAFPSIPQISFEEDCAESSKSESGSLGAENTSVE